MKSEQQTEPGSVNLGTFETGPGRWVLRNVQHLNPSDFKFEPFRPGVDRAILIVDDNTGSSTALLRYAPGAKVPAHRHTGYEHIFVLSGSQSDEDGTYGPGTVLIHAPGTQHRVWTDEGCLVLAVWERPVEFI
jgi:anti-sigma factor ChrR (cupin superfamily)